jgi:L-asparaginase
LLKQLGWINPTVAQSLEESFLSTGKYSRLETIGELSLA